MTVTWISLAEAYAHVSRHERSHELAEHRLRYVLGERLSGPQVRCRAGFVIAPMQRGRERSNVMLPADFWVLELHDDSFPDRWCAIVDWEKNTARLPPGHAFAPWTAYRIEVCWENLVAIWPETKKRTRVGRKPVHDREAILAEARDYLTTHARPKSATQFAAKLKEVLRGKSIDPPERTLLVELLGPLLESSAN